MALQRRKREREREKVREERERVTERSHCVVNGAE